MGLDQNWILGYGGRRPTVSDDLLIHTGRVPHGTLFPTSFASYLAKDLISHRFVESTTKRPGAMSYGNIKLNDGTEASAKGYEGPRCLFIIRLCLFADPGHCLWHGECNEEYGSYDFITLPKPCTDAQLYPRLPSGRLIVNGNVLWDGGIFGRM